MRRFFQFEQPADLRKPVFREARGIDRIGAAMQFVLLDAYDPIISMPKFMLKKGMWLPHTTLLEASYNPTRKEYEINSLMLNRDLRKAENARRALNLLNQAEKHAQSLGATRITTGYTHFHPRLFMARGYEIAVRAWHGKYRYTKALQPHAD